MKYSAYIHSPNPFFKVYFEQARSSADSTSPTGRDIYEWIAQWSDLIRFPIATPVTEDQETGEILKRLNP